MFGKLDWSSLGHSFLGLGWIVHSFSVPVHYAVYSVVKLLFTDFDFFVLIFRFYWVADVKAGRLVKFGPSS